MSTFSRREFGGVLLALGSQARTFGASTTGIDRTLQTGIARRKIPAVAAMAATATQTLYSGAFGKRDGSSGMDVKPDSIFSIASMTKAIAATAAMQLVERGKIQLDEPASKHLPELGMAQVLHGFDGSGKPILRPPTKPVTLRHLLTHTSGFAYDTWNQEMFDYVQKVGNAVPAGMPATLTLVFEPGTRWQYGYSMDWAGKLVEAVSGQSLEQYMQTHILQPAWYEGHQLHHDGRQVRPRRQCVSEAARWNDDRECAEAASATQSLQRRRWTLFHDGRLCSLHADDFESRARR
jgi:CubicO group peptidase (beta-lactamase class C family)